MRAVACFDTTVNKAAVSDWHCKRISRKPKNKLPCNRQPCNPIQSTPSGQWIQGEWSRCSVTCDKVHKMFNDRVMNIQNGYKIFNRDCVINILL